MTMGVFSLSLPSSIAPLTSTQFLPSSNRFYVSSKMVKPSTVHGKASDHFVERRSANFQPSIWKHEFLQSLTSDFLEESCLNERDKLKEGVKMMVEKEVLVGDTLKQLEVVDELQRLGLSYHFQNQIKQILQKLNQRFHSGEDMEWCNNNNLYATALHFRILRQHGYHIPQEVFNEFKNEFQDLSTTCEEKAKEMLSFYEASFLAIEGESFLDEARHLAQQHLLKYLEFSSDEITSSMMRHALELPLYWRMPRLEARWFIDLYERKSSANLMVLKLAKLDFNIVQSIHQDELKYVSGWWKSTGLGEELDFVRDRLMGSFFWAVAMGWEPHIGYHRKMTTKIASLITIIDDVYDVYGTLDELQLFTDAVERWDIAAIDSLPEYMKICFIALHNTINDMTFDALKKHNVNVIKYLSKMWTDLCKSFLMEAKWYYTNYKPTFQEYLDNAWISVSGPLILGHAYVFASDSITKEALECFEDYPDIIRHSSMIFRLANDLASSSKEAERGEVAKSLQCYMNDTDASEDEARTYIEDLIILSWKRMNEAKTSNSASLSSSFIEMVMNLARFAQTVYKHRDGHTVEDHETKDRVVSLFIKPT